jgi:hypothetical protein
MRTRADGDGPPISTILAELGRNGRGERLYLRDVTAALGDRAFGLLILVFALPNAVGLGTIPGVSTVFGLPQIFVAAQMVVRPERLWLPAWLLDRSIARGDFERMITKALPYILRLERLLRERWMPLSPVLMERVLGVIFLLLALVVSLPIPFANQPPSVAAALLAIGLMARDGAAIVLGLVAAALALALATLVVLGGAEAILAALRHLFG